MQPDLGRLSTAAHHGVRHALGHVLHPQSPGAPRRRSTPRDRLGPQHPHAPRPSADSRPWPLETPVLCCTRTAPHHTPCTAHTSHAPYSSTYSTCMTHTTHTRPAPLLHTWHARGTRTTLLHTRHTHQTRTAPSHVAHTTHCALSPLCSSSVRPQSHSAHLTPQGARGSGRGSCRRASQDGSWTWPGLVSPPRTGRGAAHSHRGPGIKLASRLPGHGLRAQQANPAASLLCGDLLQGWLLCAPAVATAGTQAPS